MAIKRRSSKPVNMKMQKSYQRKGIQKFHLLMDNIDKVEFKMSGKTVEEIELIRELNPK